MRHGCQICYAILLTLTAGLAAAESPTDPLKITIEPQSLATALQTLSKESGLQIGFASEIARNVQTRGTRAAKTPKEALDDLLAGTNLEYSFANDHTIVIREKGVPTAAEAGETPSLRLARAQTAPTTAENTAKPAESGTEPDLALEEVVVTGTNIRGTTPEASPLISFDREDIERSGYATLGDFIQKGVPQNFAAGASEDSLNAGTRNGANLNTGRGAGVNLRGLGNDSTLVLLNGRRMAPAGFGSFVDISMIPASAIERIDILTDGASATYGSDAIGGVVNFVLREDFNGAETRLGYGSLTEGDGDLLQAGQTFGTSWHSGRALVAYDYYSRDSLDTKDRDRTVNALDPTDILPEQTHHSVIVTTSQKLTETVSLFADALYTNRDADSRFFNPFSLLPEFMTRNNEQINASVGSRIALGSTWGLELAGTYSENDLHTKQLTGGSTPSALRVNERFHSWFADAKADGNVLQLPGGSMKAAFGGQYRTEEFDRRRFSTTTEKRQFDRNIFAAFGEIFTPLVGAANRLAGVQRLELTLAARYEEYSDFGNSIDPKIGLLWVPSPTVKLRGTWGTSFRAPLLTELDDSDIAVGILDFTDSSVPAGTSFGTLLLGNNRELGPEDARTWTLGADFELPFAPRLQTSITYFDIDFADRIGIPDTLTLAFGDIADPLVAPFVDRTPDIDRIQDAVASATANGSVFDFTGGVDPATSAVLLDGRTQNLARTDVNGLDLRLAYEIDGAGSQWDFTFNSSYLFGFREQPAPAAPFANVVDTVFNPADLRLRAGLGWRRKGVGANVFVNYVDSYEDQRVSPARGIASWTTVDVRFNVNLAERSGKTANEGTQLFAAVLNAFDKQPPFVADDAIDGFNLNFDPENHDIEGRSFLAGLTYHW